MLSILSTVSKGSPTKGLHGPPPQQPLGTGNAGCTGTRLVGLGKQMARLTMEGLFVIADEDGQPFSRCVPACSRVCCAGLDRKSQGLPIHRRVKEMQRRRQLGAAVIIPWGSNVTRPDTQTVLLEGGDPLCGAEQQAVSFLTPPQGDSA